MFRTLALISFAISALTAQAATWHLLDTAPDGGNGLSWSSAWNGTGGINWAAVSRGDTIYYASGSYLGGRFEKATSGTTRIYIKHATIGAHGSSVGWSDAYASGQTVFLNTWDLRSSYLDIDGVTGTGKSGHGIRMINSLSGQEVGSVHVFNGFTASFINLYHIEGVGTGTDTQNGQLTYWIRSQQNGGTDWNISDCYVHDFYTWAQTYQIAQVVIERSWFKNSGSNSGLHHGDGFAFQGANWTLRYNVLENMIGSANTTYVEAQGNPTVNPQIYNNCLTSTDANESTVQYSGFSTAGVSTVLGGGFCNNLLDGLRGPSPGVQAAGSGMKVQNNIWVNCANFPSITATTVDHNILNNQTVSFVDRSSLNYHLAADTPLVRVALPQPLDVDTDGNRYTSSVGPFQYGGTPPVGTAIQVTSVTTTNVPGYYKAGATFRITVNWNDTATITGTPVLALNSGGTATYVSGSGTTSTVFTYTVLAGQNSTRLDYANATALTGGTIQHLGVNATRTLPTPGGAGSLSASQLSTATSLILDTIAPTISIGVPTPLVTPNGRSVAYVVTYADANFQASTLSTNNLTITAPTLTYAVDITGSGATRTITFSSLTGEGSLAFSIASGTASDLAGNLAPGTGASQPLDVFGGRVLRVKDTRANQILITLPP